ncbi:MAG TPA: TlyA family RNA methyltransferase [Methylovirgula sp.]|nr:TlyA family RNA methyltransferase [Methylovirgula sp.]
MPAPYPHIALMPQRADLVLVERGLFESRAKAQEAIAAGRVRADGRVLRKPSEPIGADAEIEATAPYPWVSRGGVKLEAALVAFGFDVAGATCLDAGASTGGFTDVLLTRGAVKVYAVDVGHGQLHPRLAADPRVVSSEGRDVRTLLPSDFSEPPSFLTCDVSFISLSLVLPAILAVASPRARLVALIKPQFEVGPAHVVKGIVQDAALHRDACIKIERLLREAGWQIAGLVDSPIRGGDGNREYLIGASKL